MRLAVVGWSVWGPKPAARSRRSRKLTLAAAGLGRHRIIAAGRSGNTALTAETSEIGARGAIRRRLHFGVHGARRCSTRSLSANRHGPCWAVDHGMEM